MSKQDIFYIHRTKPDNSVLNGESIVNAFARVYYNKKTFISQEQNRNKFRNELAQMVEFYL